MIALALFALPALAQDIPVPAVDAQLYHLPVDATSTAWAADSHIASGFVGCAIVGSASNITPRAYSCTPRCKQDISSTQGILKSWTRPR